MPLARKNVNILLKLEDKFTKPMKGASKEVKRAQRAMMKLDSGVFGFSRTVRKGFTSAVSHVAKFGAALAGIGGVLSIAGLKSFAAEAEELAKAQIEAETKLEAALKNVQSIAAQGTEGIASAKQELLGVASALQKVGVIGDEVTIAGMQQLATYQMGTEEISALSKGMDDLLAKQYGANATQENAVAIAKMLGKAYQGNYTSLERAGVLLTEEEKTMLKFGDDAQRAAVLSQALERSVGGVNEALADTDQGRLQQFANQWGDMKEEVGKHILSLKANLAKNFAQYIPKIQEIAVAAVEKISALVTRAVEWAKAHSEQIKAALVKVKDGLMAVWRTVKPVLSFAVKHADVLLPAILHIVAAISAVSVVADVATKVGGLVKRFKDLHRTIKEAGGVLSWLKTGPIGLIILGIAAAVAAVIYLYNHCEKFRNFVKKAAAVIVAAWNRIKDTAVRVKDGAVAAFKTLQSVVTTIFSNIKAVIKKVMDWIEQKIEAVKRAIEAIKQTWQDLTSGPWMSGVTETGYVSKTEAGHATGTTYFAGGATRINEGGRGEIVTLPSGTQIIPHDVAKKSTGDTVINLNFTIAGNVIGNRAFMEETGRYVTEKVKAALAVV